MNRLTLSFVLIVVCVPVLSWSAQQDKASMSAQRLLLVVNPHSADSLTIANYYAKDRDVPADNIMALSWDDAKTSASWQEFHDKIFIPVWKEARQRNCLAVAFSSGFPISIDISKTFVVPNGEIPENMRDVMISSGSLTGMVYLGPLLEQLGAPPWNLSVVLRNYYIYLHGIPLLPSIDEERVWKTEPFDDSLLSKHLPCVCLAVKTPTYPVESAVNNLRRSIQADGTFPQGTIYLMVNSDIRSKTRQPDFNRTIESIARLALQKKYDRLQAKREDGTLPQNKTDIIGLVAGSAVLDWSKSGSQIVPGAFCEHLTSFGGALYGTCGQTPLTAFLLAGAAGSSGTVTEPFAIAQKFPSCAFHVHYISGLTQIESFYHSIRWPYQTLYVGDPLCQPWSPKKEPMSRNYDFGPAPTFQLTVLGADSTTVPTTVPTTNGNAGGGAEAGETATIEFGQSIQLKLSPLPQEVGAIRVLQGTRAVLETTVTADPFEITLSSRQLGCGPVLLRLVGLNSVGKSVFQKAFTLEIKSLTGSNR